MTYTKNKVKIKIGGKNIPLKTIYPLEKDEGNKVLPGEILQEARLLVPHPNDTSKKVMLVLMRAKLEEGNIHEIDASTGEPKIDSETGQPILWPGETLLSFYRAEK